MAPALTPQLETFTAGVETAVDVAAIERQLRDLWSLAAESERDPSRRHITRACLFNFVAFCETDAARDHTNETISALTSRHPCRAIVLLAQPGSAPSELSASITAHCHLASGGGKQVCCEQISINASGASVAHLAAAMLPLLESDLPTVLWWQGNFLEKPDLFARLSAVTDRVLFDSSAWPDPKAHLGKLADAIRNHPRCQFGDLSWTRLALWRKLAAEVFDEIPCRSALSRVNRVEVAHGRGPGASMRALLYASWIAAQLGWPAADAARRIRLSARDDDDATSVGILSVTLAGDGVEVCVRKNYGERTASASVTLANVCALPRKRAFWPTDDVSLLSRELDHVAPHTVYDRALQMAASV